MRCHAEQDKKELPQQSAVSGQTLSAEEELASALEKRPQQLDDLEDLGTNEPQQVRCANALLAELRGRKQP